MKKTATIVASILFTFAAIAAGTSQSSNGTPAAEYDGPVSTAPQAAVYDGPVSTKGDAAPDYKLERESCCGPQS
jgi:hypothetical protein